MVMGDSPFSASVLNKNHILREFTYSAIRPVSLGLAILYAIFTVSHISSQRKCTKRDDNLDFTGHYSSRQYSHL